MINHFVKFTTKNICSVEDEVNIIKPKTKVPKVPKAPKVIDLTKPPKVKKEKKVK